MPTHVEPIVLVDANEEGIIYRVVNPAIMPPAIGSVILSKGFYRISMGMGAHGFWGLNFTPTVTAGCIIGANSSQVIYVPADNTTFGCCLGSFAANPGELSINPLLVWEMPGNLPPDYDLYQNPV